MSNVSLDFKTLGDEQKSFEKVEASRSIMPGIPIIARLDGKSFHTFTKGLIRPFDTRLQNCMRETMMYLVDITNADVGYTQSDEITLVWRNHDRKAEAQYSGKFQKLTSLFAAHATAKFNDLIRKELPEKSGALPVFDCRVWQVPNFTCAIENIMWRQDDAIRNSVTMAAQAHFSHKQLHGVGTTRKLKMLADKGIIWAEFNAHFRSGIFARRFKYWHTLSTTEMNKIPEQHRPTGPVLRSAVMPFELLSGLQFIEETLLYDKDNNFVDNLPSTIKILSEQK